MLPLSNQLTSGRRVLGAKQMFALGLLVIGFMSAGITYAAQTSEATVRLVRTILPSEWEVYYPSGVAYSAQPAQWHLLEKSSIKVSPLLGIDIVTITTNEQFVAKVHLDYVIGHSINIVFADDGDRLFLLSKDAQRIAQVKKDASGIFDPTTLIEIDLSWLGLIQPQGMSIDADNKYLYILDGAGPRLIRTKLLEGSGVDDRQVQIINLARLGISAARGVAVHPLTDNVFVGNPTEKQLYEISPAATVIRSYDLSSLKLVDQQAMVFAPSSDQTDPATDINLFVADSNLADSSPTPIPTAPTSTPIATEPTATAIATALTSTPIATAPTSTPISTVPATSTAISTAPATSTPISTAPATSTAISTAPASTPSATATFAQPAPTSTKVDVPGVPGQVNRLTYLPFVTLSAQNGVEVVKNDTVAAPVFGRVVEVTLVID